MNTEQLEQAMQLTVAKPVAVYVPDWKAIDGGKVHVIRNTVGDLFGLANEQTAEREQLKAKGMSEEDISKRMAARSIARRMCDETGKRTFDPDNEKHIDLILNQETNTFNKVLSAISGTADEEDKDAGKSEGATS